MLKKKESTEVTGNKVPAGGGGGAGGSQITDYHVYNCTILTCTVFYTQSIA